MSAAKGFFKKWLNNLDSMKKQIKERLNAVWNRETIIEEDWEKLEEALIQTDIGPRLAMEIVEELQTTKSENKDWQSCLFEKLYSIIEKNDARLFPAASLQSSKVIVLMGINGAGKTTLAGKLARFFKDQGEKVSLIAADTFRAAAQEQLEVWAKRAGVNIIKFSSGTKPGAAVFDALQLIKKRGDTVAIVDTAGRSHVNKNLLSELEKLSKIISREIPPSNVENLLVIDALAGQNAFLQAENIAKFIPITGIALTKWDSQAKGGIVFRIHQELSLPIKLVGTGEAIEDLFVFDPEEFVRAIVY